MSAVVTIESIASASGLSQCTHLGYLRSAQDLVGDILRPFGLECSRHGWKSLIEVAKRWVSV